MELFWREGMNRDVQFGELLPEELLSHSALLLGFAGSHQDVSES